MATLEAVVPWTRAVPGAALILSLALAGCSNSDKGIRGSYYGSGDAGADIPRLAALALAGELDLGGVVTSVDSLEAVNEALDRLREGAGVRTVLAIDRPLAGLA